VTTIIVLARRLGRRAIAEGIEQQVELDGLRQLDCELGQGYHLRRPGDASTLEAELGLRSLPA
jgi:EAL domain-containing protein (putative c-di-GMP-specific phosphodiesterase class I)